MSTKELRETAAELAYGSGQVGVPWPWNVPDGTWTYESFESLPEDGNRYEVIGGRLTMSPPPVERHQAVSVNLIFQIVAWAKQTGSGRVYHAPFAVVLSFLPPEQHYVEPDLLFISRERLSIIKGKNVQGAPDLIIEILSPSTARADWVDKKSAYEGGGVAHYWVVDPAGKSLTAFRLKDGKYEPAGSLENDAVFEPEGFPGLRINLTEVWE